MENAVADLLYYLSFIKIGVLLVGEKTRSSAFKKLNGFKFSKAFIFSKIALRIALRQRRRKENYCLQ